MREQMALAKPKMATLGQRRGHFLEPARRDAASAGGWGPFSRSPSPGRPHEAGIAAPWLRLEAVSFVAAPEEGLFRGRGYPCKPCKKICPTK